MNSKGSLSLLWLLHRYQDFWNNQTCSKNNMQSTVLCSDEVKEYGSYISYQYQILNTINISSNFYFSSSSKYIKHKNFTWIFFFSLFQFELFVVASSFNYETGVILFRDFKTVSSKISENLRQSLRKFQKNLNQFSVLYKA